LRSDEEQEVTEKLVRANISKEDPPRGIGEEERQLFWEIRKVKSENLFRGIAF
jgi:hypothetical protein